MKERSKWLHSPLLPKGFTIFPTLHQQSFDQLGEQQNSASGCHRTGSTNSCTGSGIFCLFVFVCCFKEDFLTSVCSLNTAIICQERLSPLTAASSLASTTQHTTGVTVARSHHRPALSWLSPGLPGHLLQSWCFPMVGNYCSQQKCEYEPKIHIFILFYSSEKSPF